MSIKDNVTSNVIAIVVTGAVSTAANVTALNVHLSYQKADIKRIELAQAKADEQIKMNQLAIAVANSNAG